MIAYFPNTSEVIDQAADIITESRNRFTYWSSQLTLDTTLP